jgi:hypothetical protein
MIGHGLEPYPGAGRQWRCLCLRCGAEVAPRYGNIQQGWGGCPACRRAASSARQRGPEAEAIEALRAAGLEPLEPYQGVMMPWQSQCRTCGNQVAPLLNNIKKGQRGCKWCSGRVIDPAEAAEVMRAAGLEPLTAYPGAHAPWPCRCQRCHEAVTPRYRAVQAGSDCRYCNDTAINPEAAVSLMRKAGLEPLEQYPGSLRPWTCRCNKCGRTVQPCYSTIQRGSGGCRWCRNSGFKSAENAIVHLITHPGHSAAKIGITDAGGSRLKKHSQQGWQILATVQVPGELALSIEKEILDWWRGELALPVHLGKPEMPHGGWTETVDSTEPVWLQRSSGSRVAPPRHTDRERAPGLRAGFGLLWVMRCCQALEDLFHAGQAGVEGDLDQPPPDLFAAVLVIGQVEGRVREQVGCPGVARVRDRPQARGVEDVRDRPFGHYVHDPRLRDGEDVGSGQVGQRGGDFLLGQRGEHRVDERAELLGRPSAVRVPAR